MAGEQLKQRCDAAKLLARDLVSELRGLRDAGGDAHDPMWSAMISARRAEADVDVLIEYFTSAGVIRRAEADVDLMIKYFPSAGVIKGDG